MAAGNPEPQQGKDCDSLDVAQFQALKFSERNLGVKSEDNAILKFFGYGVVAILSFLIGVRLYNVLIVGGNDSLVAAFRQAEPELQNLIIAGSLSVWFFAYPDALFLWLPNKLRQPVNNLLRKKYSFVTYVVATFLCLTVVWSFFLFHSGPQSLIDYFGLFLLVQGLLYLISAILQYYLYAPVALPIEEGYLFDREEVLSSKRIFNLADSAIDVPLVHGFILPQLLDPALRPVELYIYWLLMFVYCGNALLVSHIQMREGRKPLVGYGVFLFLIALMSLALSMGFPRLDDCYGKSSEIANNLQCAIVAWGVHSKLMIFAFSLAFWMGMFEFMKRHVANLRKACRELSDSKPKLDVESSTLGKSTLKAPLVAFANSSSMLGVLVVPLLVAFNILGPIPYSIIVSGTLIIHVLWIEGRNKISGNWRWLTVVLRTLTGLAYAGLILIAFFGGANESYRDSLYHFALAVNGLLVDDRVLVVFGVLGFFWYSLGSGIRIRRERGAQNRLILLLADVGEVRRMTGILAVGMFLVVHYLSLFASELQVLLERDRQAFLVVLGPIGAWLEQFSIQLTDTATVTSLFVVKFVYLGLAVLVFFLEILVRLLISSGDRGSDGKSARLEEGEKSDRRISCDGLSDDA